jgi:hypothetical protein
MRTLAEDISPEAERVLIDLWRKATPAEKFSTIANKTHALQESMLADLRECYPHETSERLRRRFADLWLGPDLARKAYGEMPDDFE